MLDVVIRVALRYRVLTSVSALVILFYGGLAWRNLPIDIFPDLDRPRVTILTEAQGPCRQTTSTSNRQFVMGC